MSKANNIASLLNSSGLLDSDDIATSAITNSKIASDAITAAKLNIGQVGGRRNIIINGAMQVAQRGTSETGITSAFTYHTADRFRTGFSGLGTWTQTQNSDAPDGFSSSLKLECTTDNTSPAATAYAFIRQEVEGQNLQHLKKGTSSAESITTSFWVKSNKTGTYVLEIRDNHNGFRHINKSYTINASGTWEYKTITFQGDTTGTFNNDNTAGLSIQFWLGGGSNFNTGTLQTSWGTLTEANRAVGQVNLADSTDNADGGTTNNYFQITGVQLEVGETATPFEHRSYGEELALCQRYYFEQDGMLVYANTTRSSAVDRSAFFWPVTMRAAPTVTTTYKSGFDTGTSVVEAINTTSCSFGKNNATGSAVMEVIEAYAEL